MCSLSMMPGTEFTVVSVTCSYNYGDGGGGDGGDDA